MLDAFSSDGGIDAASPLDKPDGTCDRPRSGPARLLRHPRPGHRRTRRPVPPGRYGLRLLPALVRPGTGRCGLGKGISALMAFEVEWMVGRMKTTFIPPSMARLRASRFAAAADYVRDVLEGLKLPSPGSADPSGDGPAQFEVSMTPQDPCRPRTPVSWSSWCIFRRHRPARPAGLDRSVVPADNVETAGTCMSASGRTERTCSPGSRAPWRDRDRQSVMAGPCWKPARPASHRAGPSTASYLRLLPSRWAGIYQVWGRRTGRPRCDSSRRARRPRLANVELLKCFDSSANPYLVAGAGRRGGARATPIARRTSAGGGQRRSGGTRPSAGRSRCPLPDSLGEGRQGAGGQHEPAAQRR